jgi:hypothetical protein
MQPRNYFASRGADYHFEGDYKAIFLGTLHSVVIHESFSNDYNPLLIRPVHADRYPTVTVPVHLYG